MARKKAAAKRGLSDRSINDTLRGFILARDLTDTQLGQLADVAPAIIGRFMRRERDISGPTIDRLCAALGLDLVERSTRGRGRPAREREEPSPGTKRGRPLVSGLGCWGDEGPTQERGAGNVDRPQDPAEGPDGRQADFERST